MTASNSDIIALLDTILPGGEGYPSASEAGLLDRTIRGPDLADASDKILAVAGGDFASKNHDERSAILALLESEQPDAFQSLLTAAYTVYYSTPAVLSVISATTSYQHPPQPGGYVMPAFDEAVLAKVRHDPISWRDTNPTENEGIRP